MATITRRALLVTPALLAAGSRLTAQGSVSAGPASSNAAASTKLSAAFPTHDPDLVREVVGVSHGNIARLKELVDRQPALARASWDWGFGDWESALGAASHVGNREIAEYLLSKGARPSIFSATMLGQLDVVKAFVAAQPGVQKTWGPHGITLLSHASAGGAPAKPVLEYLTALGDANDKPALTPLTEEEMKKLSGSYAWGPGADEKFEIGIGKGVLTIIRPGRTQRSLLHLGSYESYPIGSFAARFRFAETGGAWVLTLNDPDVVLTARRS